MLDLLITLAAGCVVILGFGIHHFLTHAGEDRRWTKGE